MDPRERDDMTRNDAISEVAWMIYYSKRITMAVLKNLGLSLQEGKSLEDIENAGKLKPDQIAGDIPRYTRHVATNLQGVFAQ